MAGELRVLRRAPVTTLANIGVSFLLAALCYNVISLLTSSEDGIQQNSVEIVGNDLNQVNSFCQFIGIKSHFASDLGL